MSMKQGTREIYTVCDFPLMLRAGTSAFFKVQSEKSKVDSLDFFDGDVSYFCQKYTRGGARPAVQTPGLSGAGVK